MRGLMGGLDPEAGSMPEGLGSNPSLERIYELVDWPRFESLVSGLEAARVGKGSYPPLMMAKVLLLQRLYNLSDARMAEALADRISFRRFVGLSLGDGTPGRSAIGGFKAALKERGLGERLFLELRRQMDARGVRLQHGAEVSAEFVKADTDRLRRRRGS